MDPESAGRDPPVALLLGSRVEQPGEPCQRYCEGSAVGQIDRESVLRDANILHAFARIRVRSTHSMPPAATVDFLGLPARSERALGRKIRGSEPEQRSA